MADPSADPYDPPIYPSIYFGIDDVDELRAFDEQFKSRQGAYSRSDEIKRAMRTHRVIDETLADLGFEAASERDREALIRQALYDHFRE